MKVSYAHALVPAVAAVTALVCSLTPAQAFQIDRKTITAIAAISPRSSLTMSAEILHFRQAASGETPTAVVEFVARARTHIDGEVVLTAEYAGDLDDVPPASEGTVTFRGEGAETMKGTLPSGETVVVARWTGGGTRVGRLIFGLRASAADVVVPVGFVLSTP